MCVCVCVSFSLVGSCPFGAAWFDEPSQDNKAHAFEECSNAGICDRIKGECLCMPEFEGAACERLKCPGVNSPCSNNGKCLTMSQLAAASTVNGVPMGFTYGNTPNKPSTWDHQKIQGCVCDPGFTGHDCSLRLCPLGDNPRTTGQAKEIQTVLCTETSVSTFQLTFRGATSANIGSHATEHELKAALEALPTIGQVDVTFSLGDQACTVDSSNTISILFITELGDLPALTPTVTDPVAIPSIVVDTDGTGTSLMGTVENVECSNNGICNRMNGQCSCFAGMGSSGSSNVRGHREDCGYVLAVLGGALE